jgi:hypothetical protein
MKSRISLVTALAVGATVIAGSGAIAANIGVLTSADDDSIGNLSAETPVQSPSTTENGQVVDVYLEDPVVASTDASGTTAEPATAATERAVQEFTVEAAGTVAVDQSDTGLVVTEVVASEGWLWKTEQTSTTEVTVIFASTDTIYEFVASVNADGDIVARVDQPIVNVVQVPAPTPGQSTGGGATPAATPATVPSATVPSAEEDDDHEAGEDHEEYEDHEDHEEYDHEDDDTEEDEEDEEYEGGDDDD